MRKTLEPYELPQLRYAVWIFPCRSIPENWSHWATKWWKPFDEIFFFSFDAIHACERRTDGRTTTYASRISFNCSITYYSFFFALLQILKQARHLVSTIRTPSLSAHETRVRDFCRYMESEIIRVPECAFDECSFQLIKTVRGFSSAGQQHAYQQVY